MVQYCHWEQSSSSLLTATPLFSPRWPCEPARGLKTAGPVSATVVGVVLPCCRDCPGIEEAIEGDVAPKCGTGFSLAQRPLRRGFAVSSTCVNSSLRFHCTYRNRAPWRPASGSRGCRRHGRSRRRDRSNPCRPAGHRPLVD